MRTLLLAALALLLPSAATAQQFGFIPPDMSDVMTVTSANATIADIRSHLPTQLNDITLAQSSLLTLQTAGFRKFDVATNCIAGDRLVLTPPPEMPDGFALGGADCPVTGSMRVWQYTPQLPIGQGYSITYKVTAFR